MNSLTFQNNQVNYYRFGSGTDFLFAFHGYNDTGLLFEKLADEWKKHYTIIAIDAPFHGKTNWGNDIFTPDDVIEILSLISQKENIKTIDLMGYSMGGRIVQKILPFIKINIKNIYLIAPDGYSNYPFPPNRFIYKIVRHFLAFWTEKQLYSFIKISQLLHQYRILSSFNFYFVKRHIIPPDTRKKLFSTWASIEKFIFTPKEAKKICDNMAANIYLIIGNKDTIIPASTFDYWLKNTPKIKPIRLEQGHSLINESLPLPIVPKNT